MKILFIALALLAGSFVDNAYASVKMVKALDSNGVEQTYPTGYTPNADYHLHAMHRDFSAKLGATAIDPIPLEYSLKENVQRIFSQQCGDCWAQGAATTFETLISWADKASIFVSRQQVIDCSGFGSCGGGDISLGDFTKPKGAVYEADYPYKGYDEKCKTGLTYHQSVDNKPFFISDLTWPNLQRAVMETGPIEVCGASSALGNGGWVSHNYSGGTDHCYSMVGWYDGATHQKPGGSYAIIANSWGTSWGDKGFGYYLMAKDGTHLDGSVITEAAGVAYKPACTPQPSADAGPDQKLILEGN